MDEQKKPQEMHEGQEQKEHKVLQLSGMYKNWFLDYASYVILERAVPNLRDGLKPVQRRLMHSMRELEDGRFNKVANIIGNTMKYHPHGDASIGDALVQMGQKDLLIDMQGNWGNVLTGDSAAAARYIEARLSKFALEVVFNPKTTRWKLSYDGRNKEPVELPVKFPLLLAQGSDGIAVGLSTKILPHNFNEIIDACIAHLKGQDFELLPDFMMGGMMDTTRYNEGMRGGKVRVRAKMSSPDKKTLVITEIPYTTTTGSLIESIISANDKGKIKIKKIEDNTAQNVEIVIQLAPGVSSDQTMDALYAFTDCEVSISPLCCVIDNQMPLFTGVKDLLRKSADSTLALLKMELDIHLAELLESHMYSSLEKIFIEKRIYRDIEECTTWENVIKAIDLGLKPYKKKFYREITTDDIVKLTEIRIKRISKFDSFKADEIIRGLEKEMEEVKANLNNLIEYAIDYYRKIKKKYGKGRERKTELRSFETIEAATVAVANQKLYVNREEGFFGTGLKKDEYICECSELDDVIVFRSNGSFIVTKVSEKSFFGPDIIHIDVFRKNDERTIYNAIYRDGPSGSAYIKRFFVKGVTRDKEYTLTKGAANSRVLYFTVNPNGEAETISVVLLPRPKLKKLTFDFDFSELAIKGRQSQGNILTRYITRKIVMKDQGRSTLGGLHLWFDDEVKRLNTEEKGNPLGEFSRTDKIITFMQSGAYRFYQPDVQVHFEDDLLFIGKYTPRTVFTLLYFNAKQDCYYVKRFQAETNGDRRVEILDEGDELVLLSVDWFPRLKMIFDNKKLKKPKDPELIDISEFIGIKGIKAKGKRISTLPLKKVEFAEPAPSSEEKIKELLGENELVDDEPTPNKQVHSQPEKEVNIEPEDDGQIRLDL